jgi:uncharacterized protein (TIGR00369 family)
MNELYARLKKMMTGEHAPPPISSLVGFRIASIFEGRVEIELEAQSRHHNPMGTLHGGILCDIADAAMGMAYATTLAESESFTTLELKINFLKTVRTGPLHARGKVVKRGRTIGLTDCEVVNDNNELVAYATSTCMTLRGEQARGR